MADAGAGVFRKRGQRPRRTGLAGNLVQRGIAPHGRTQQAGGAHAAAAPLGERGTTYRAGWQFRHGCVQVRVRKHEVKVKMDNLANVIKELLPLGRAAVLGDRKSVV